MGWEEPGGYKDKQEVIRSQAMAEDCGEGELSVEKPRASDFASAQQSQQFSLCTP